MKTQIQNLINGCKDVCRMLEHPKYATAKQATSHIGYAGTNDKDRAEIAAKVATENPDDMTIRVRGEKLTAKRTQSHSGKSWAWTAQISRATYESFGGIANYKDSAETYRLCITGDCFVMVYKKIKGSGKGNGYEAIDEAFITIE